jgi:ornithine decarboxylase
MIPEAKFVLSKARLFEQYNKLKELNLGISYSLKTNLVVGKILERERDCFFSVHTIHELDCLEDKSRVWFLAESWDRDTINTVIEKGVRNFVVYNVHDLRELEDYINQNNIEINLLLRGKLRENTIFTERYFVFGMPSRQLNDSIRRARKNKNINRLGVHFHRKTQNVSEWELKYEIKNLIEKENFNLIDLINIGGGLPVKYRNTGDDSISFIFNKIIELRDFLKEKEIQLLVEPGRFLSAPSISLKTFVQSVIGKNITVNCSVYNTFMDSLIIPLRLLVEGELPSGKGRNYLIKGFTPCSLDIFRYSVELPEKKRGDEIVFLNAGAYNFHTTFCSLPKLKTEIVE